MDGDADRRGAVGRVRKCAQLFQALLRRRPRRSGAYERRRRRGAANREQLAEIDAHVDIELYFCASAAALWRTDGHVSAMLAPLHGLGVRQQEPEALGRSRASASAQFSGRGPRGTNRDRATPPMGRIRRTTERSGRCIDRRQRFPLDSRWNCRQPAFVRHIFGDVI
jgi:hypothetical protein